jgi:hypothetical protein
MTDQANIPTALAYTPKEGKGGWGTRGSAEQRRQFYARFREHTEEALSCLLGIIRDPDADNGHKVQASKEILNRGWGAAPQVHVVDQSMEHRLSMNMDFLRQMSDDELAVYQRMLLRLAAQPQDVVDAEVVETTNESASHAPAGGRRRRIAGSDGGQPPSRP